jgi:hypothetical protein
MGNLRSMIEMSTGRVGCSFAAYAVQKRQSCGVVHIIPEIVVIFVWRRSDPERSSKSETKKQAKPLVLQSSSPEPFETILEACS